MDDTVFDRAPTFTNDNKREREPEEDRANTKAKFDSYEDPYCDLTTLYEPSDDDGAYL